VAKYSVMNKVMGFNYLATEVPCHFMEQWISVLLLQIIPIDLCTCNCFECFKIVHVTFSQNIVILTAKHAITPCVLTQTTNLGQSLQQTNSGQSFPAYQFNNQLGTITLFVHIPAGKHGTNTPILTWVTTLHILIQTA
jgi:hypothetical protein